MQKKKDATRRLLELPDQTQAVGTEVEGRIETENGNPGRGANAKGIVKHQMKTELT